MNNLVANKEDNIEGLYSFLVIPAIDVQEIPDAVAGLISDAITLDYGKIWYSVEVTPEANNMAFSDASKDGHITTVRGFIAGDSPALVTALKEYADYEYFILIAGDLNGNKRLIGTLDNPAVFTYSYDTNGRRGYEINFRAQTIDPPPFIEFTGTDPGEEPGSCPIIYLIDGGDETTTFDPINGYLDGGDEV